jgi:hypothetical protein
MPRPHRRPENRLAPIGHDMYAELGLATSRHTTGTTTCDCACSRTCTLPGISFPRCSCTDCLQHTQNVRRPTLPVLLQPAAALPQMGVLQQARVLLLDCCGLRGSNYVGYRATDSEVSGRGAEAEDSDDLSWYV